MGSDIVFPEKKMGKSLWFKFFLLLVAVSVIALSAAFVVRELTVRNVDNIKKYRYLKNGAMYSILFLGIIMIMEGFSVHIPFWISPVITFGVVGFFLVKSMREIPRIPGSN